MALAPQTFALTQQDEPPLAPPPPAVTFDQLAAAPAAFQTAAPLPGAGFGAPAPVQAPVPVDAAAPAPTAGAFAPPVPAGFAPPQAAPTTQAPAPSAEPDYEKTIRAVQSGDPALRPLKQEYERAYDAQPEEGPKAQRAWLLRHGLNPDDTTEAGQQRARTWLGYNRQLREMGYTEEQVARIAVEADDKPEARRALFESMRSRVVEDVDRSFSLMREQVAGRLDAQLNESRDAREMQEVRLLQEQHARRLAAIDTQRRQALQSDAAIQQQNRLNSFVNPVTGKVEYLPGYSPKEAARPEQINLRFEQQREQAQAQFDQQLSRLDARASGSALRQEEAQNKERLRQWDREAGAQKSAIIRARVADMNSFLAARLEDAKPDSADGALLPYKDDAELAREKQKKTEGTLAGAAGDILLDLAKGATVTPASGVAQVLAWGTDKIGLSDGALGAVQRFFDSAESTVEGLRSDAGAEQKKQQSETIAKAVEGKTGADALVAGVKAGVGSFGLDRNTFGQIAGMAGAVLLGGGVGFGARLAAGGAKGAAAVSALAEGGAVAADRAGRITTVTAFVGQSADSASRDAGSDMAQLLKDPQYRASSPLLADLKTRFPSYSDAQIDEIAIRQVRGAAAAGGAAATAATLIIPGLGGLEGQLLRVGVPLAGAARQGASGTALRAASRAVSEGLQEGAEALVSGAAAAAQAGGLGQTGLFADAGKLGVAVGAGAVLGGVVGNAHAAYERLKGRGGPAAPTPTPAQGAAPTAPEGFGPPVPAQSADQVLGALPSPADVRRADAQAALDAASLGTAGSGDIDLPSSQTLARMEAARIAGEDASKIPEIERVLLDIGHSADSATGASVAALVGEYATAFGVSVPEGSVLHFANNKAHYPWAEDLVAGKEETVVFSTPPGVDGVAVTRSLTPDGTNVFTARGYDGTSAVIGEDAAADSDLHTYGAAVLAGLNQLGADIRTGAKESLAADTVLLQTAEAVRANAVEDYRTETGSVDPAVAAVSAVRELQRVRATYDSVRPDIKAPLDQLLSAAFPDAPAGSAVQTILQDPLGASARISEVFSAGALTGTRGRDATRAYGAALKIAEQAHVAAHEARLAEQYLSGEAELPADIDLTRRQRAAVSSVVAQPMAVVPQEARAAALGAVPNTGRFRPGSALALDTSAATDETRAAFASFQLADDLARRPALSVAQARNLALHYTAGRGDVVATITTALQLQAEGVATAEAARQEALRLTEAQRVWEGEQTAKRLVAGALARQRAETAEGAAAIRQELVRSTRAPFAEQEFRERLAAEGRQRAAGFEQALAARGAEAARAEAERRAAAVAPTLEAQAEAARAAKAAFAQAFPMLAPKADQPVDRRVLDQLAVFMTRKFSGTKLRVEVIENDSDPRAGGNRGFAGLTVNVDASTVRVLLNRERIGSVDEAKRVIEHEVYGHFTPMEVLGPKKFAAVNAAVLRFAKSDAKTGEFLRQFTGEYRAAHDNHTPSQYQQGAEVLAYLIEQNRVNASDLTKRVSAALRGSTLTAGELTAPDLTTLLDAMAQLADGRLSIEDARIRTDILNVYFGADSPFDRQRVRTPERSAFSHTRSLWVGLREKLNSRYYLARVADIMRGLTPEAKALADRFQYSLTGMQARSASAWQQAFHDRWTEVDRAIGRAAKEAGVSFVAMQAKMDELLLARHAIDRNLWGMRLSAPLPSGGAEGLRRSAVARWKRGEISREVLAARLDELMTEDNLRQGMKEYIEGKKGEEFDPEVHKYRMDDALYAGSDMTPVKARAALARMQQDAVLMRLDAEAAPSMQRIRDALLSVRQSTGYDHYNKGSLFRETYVPITPSGESTGFGGGYERVNLEFSADTAAMRGLGDNTASRHQLATMKGLTRAATDEQVNQELMLDFLDILKNIEAKDPDMVRTLGPEEAMEGGLATLATIKNVGRHEDGDGPKRSQHDRIIVVRDKDARFGGKPGDFYEILINDKKLSEELEINKNTDDTPFGRVMKFINRTVQSSFIQYNPAGIARNAVYDVQQATMSAVKYGVSTKVAHDIGRLYAGLLDTRPDSTGRLMRTYFLGTADEKAAFMARKFSDKSDGHYLQEFVRSGAHMVFQSFNTLPGETVGNRELVESLAGKAEVSSNATARAAGEALEKWKLGTELIENIARFALFRALRGDGREPGSDVRGFSIERAAHETTKLVLDYHQTSSTAKFMSSWFFFANPSLVDLEVNLTNRIWKGGKPPTEMTKAADGTYKEVFKEGVWSSVDWNYVGLRAGLMLGQVMLLAAMLGPDEWKKLKLSDVSDKWLIPGVLVGQPGQLVKVSKNYGVDRIIDAAVAAPFLMYFGHPKSGELAQDMFNTLSKNLSPGVDLQLRDDTPVLLDILRAAAPSVAQPAFDFAAGTDRFGRRTEPSDFYRDKPAYRASSLGTEPVFYEAAKHAYRQSGGTFDWTAEQIRQFTVDYSSMVPIASLFSNFALAFGRQSAQAELNAATGRPELGAPAVFLNSIGAPVQLRDSAYSPEAEWARLHKEHVQPVLKALDDAFERDKEAGFTRRGKRTDSLDLNQMGPAEREVMRDNPQTAALIRLEREVKRPLEEARKARDEARARGDGTTMMAAQVRYRQIAEQAVQRARLLTQF